MHTPIRFGGGSGNGSDDCTATADDVLESKTAIYNGSDDEPVAGSMVDKSGTTQSATASLDTTNSRVQMTIPTTGKYSTTSKLYAAYSTIRNLIGLTAAKIATGYTILGLSGTYKGLGNATAAQVLSGKTFSTASLSNATGTMTNKAGTTTSATPSLDTTNSRVKMTIPTTAYYDTSAVLYATYSTIRNLIGLTAAKLGYGKTCLGLTGTYKPTVKQISASAACGFKSTSTSDTSEEDSYTCTAAGTCYYNGFSASESSSQAVTCEIYKNGTLVDSRNIDSDNDYAWRGTMQEQSFSVASGDVIKVKAAVVYSSSSYSRMSHIDATIVTYP